MSKPKVQIKVKFQISNIKGFDIWVSCEAGPRSDSSLERIKDGDKETQKLHQWAMGGIENESMAGSQEPG
jgi:hypothetical protein